jgi:dihydrofolate reductase
MGRKTWDAIGAPLPGRETIIVTRDPAFAPPEAHVAHSLDDALTQAQALAARMGATEIIVGGGAEIYRGLLDKTEIIHLTEVDLEVPGDAFFPRLEPAFWREIARETPPRGPRDEAAFSFVTLERRR